MPVPDPQSADHALLPALSRLPGHLLWRAHARVQLALSENLPPGVDIHAYGVLLALADGRARSQQWLATTVKVSRTTLTRVAADLDRDGLVDRVRNPDDRRSYALTRTPAGADAAHRWQRHAVALDEVVAGSLTAAERSDLAGLLRAGLDDHDPDERLDDVPDELVDSVGFLVTRTHQVVHREFLVALRPLGLEPRHVGSLSALRALGPVPQTGLARVLGVSPPSIVEIVDALEAGGLVERRRAPADRRTHALHLTAPAGSVTARALDLCEQVAARRFGRPGEVRRERLGDLLGRFVTGA